MPLETPSPYIQAAYDKIGAGAKIYYYAVFGVSFLIFAVAVFANINSIRKLHKAYLKGYYFQKECGDEYTEYESFRRHAYESLKEIRRDLDLGSYLFVVLLFWIPLALLLLGVGHVIGVTSVWVGVFAIVIVYYIFAMSRVLLERTDSIKIYQYFSDGICGSGGQELKNYKLFQLLVFLLGLGIAYGYFTLQSKTTSGTIPVFINRFPSLIPPGVEETAADKLGAYYEKQIKEGRVDIMGFGYKLFLVAQENAPVFYILLFMWLSAFVWLYFSNQHYFDLRRDVLCYYDTLMEDYKTVLYNFLIQPELEDDELKKRFNFLKEHIERNYLRIHGELPPPILDVDTLVTDYGVYLMNWKGREFETFETTESLTELREFMYRLRNDKVYISGLKRFFQFSKWYYWVQFIIVLYVLFHAIYAFMGLNGILTVGISVGGLLVFFVLSWYAWFDVALFV